MKTSQMIISAVIGVVLLAGVGYGIYYFFIKENSSDSSSTTTTTSFFPSGDSSSNPNTKPEVQPEAGADGGDAPPAGDDQSS